MPAIRPRLKLRGCGPHEQALRTAAAPGPGRTKHDALRAAVVAAGERAEALLAGGVPDGQLQALAAHRDKLQPEVHACARAPRAGLLGRARWGSAALLGNQTAHSRLLVNTFYHTPTGQEQVKTRAACRSAAKHVKAEQREPQGGACAGAPMVGALESSNWSAVKRISSEDLPTPESPTSRICRRTVLSAPSAAETGSYAGRCAAVTQSVAPVKTRRL